MDPIVNSAIGLQQAQMMSKVQYAVARKILDNQQMQGDAAVKLIQAAGQNMQKGDALVAQATGLGSEVDTYA
ncbi:MAG: hypothetical protein QM770_18340 [Tepidisphaeraceae bacterium]